MEEYKPVEIEKKWTKVWLEKKVYRAVDFDSRSKSYILIEFPYPSGERLHVGHARSYSCMDAVARKRRMQGKNVLYPMGWDAFGLPAENYAIKTGVQPSITTAKNIANAKAQAISWGLSFDWDREINTTDPDYYRWTQWIFVQMFKKGLAYKAEIPVNWCPICKINLANEEVIDGKCERCGSQTERRKQSQWLLRITRYADRLLRDLETVDYREDIKQQQVNWIGKKQGKRIRFGEVDVFTTKPETIAGVTFVGVAAEHKFATEAAVGNKEVAEYLNMMKNKADRERKMETGKSGVFTGSYVKHPVTGQNLSVWIADYVMMESGTGAIMGVPGGDERDREFAKKYGLPIVEYQDFEGKVGEEMVTYHLRDWVFSRQHYWGEPIPMVFCQTCADRGECGFSEENAACPADWNSTGWWPVPEEELPVELPKVEKYQPTDTGESPLAGITDWVNTTCPKCGGKARRETDTMPNWAGSSWYYLRYIDPQNNKEIVDEKKLRYWLPVDWYNGGMEHTTLHLLYSRFWHKFLFDIGVVPTSEPYAKRTSHGVVLGPDGKRMSKSRGNVINPDDVVNKYGADTLRLYEMFMGPFDQTVAWSWEAVEGVFRFLKRVWRLAIDNWQLVKSSDEARWRVGRLVAKLDADLEATKFNTAVAALMEFSNWWGEHKNEVGREVVEVFVKALAPLAPFITEELWEIHRKDLGSVHYQQWPMVADKGYFEAEITIVVQVDGKMRALLCLSAAEGQEGVVQLALKETKVAKLVEGKKYRVVYVPGKVVNFVVDGGSN